MSKRVAVVLSGCGVMDGSEIHESVATLLALVKAGATAVCCAPNIPQAEVINHTCNAPQAGEHRSVLVEAGRIARGPVRPLGEVLAKEFDAVVLPGGYGVVKNLSNFATHGPRCEVNPEVSRLLIEMHEASKPIGAMCIAPVLVARVLGAASRRSHLKVRLTVGTDRATAEAIEAMGAQHVICSVHNVVIDEANKVVSTPAYMLAKTVADVEAGVSKLIHELLRLCGA